MDIFTYLAKGSVKCYECDGIGNECEDNTDMGTLKDCGEGTNACMKDVGRCK